MEDGQKAGCPYTRDERDERLVLEGNIDVTDSIIESMDNKGDKYLHYTFSFKEDEISAETMKSIVKDFKEFFFSAYSPEEYNAYAEAHFPKIKSYVNEKTGETVERKPHIHIFIPKANLLTGEHLNPMGMVEQNMKFLDAWQEMINQKYGLASPKDNIRFDFTSGSEMVSRHKGDIFDGAKKEFRSEILKAVIERKVEAYEDFKKLLPEFGVVGVGNAGKPNEYLTVKPADSQKSVRLKDPVFTREFIELPTAEKNQKLSAEVKRKYEVGGERRQPAAELEATLAEWHKVRAREIKYLNSGSKVYKAYRAAEPDDKKRILDACETRFKLKHKLVELSDERANGSDRPGPDRSVRLGPDRDAGRGHDVNVDHGPGLGRPGSLGQPGDPGGRGTGEGARPGKEQGERQGQGREGAGPEQAGKGRADREPDARKHPQRPPAKSINSLRSLSSIDVVRYPERSEVLLQGDVPDHLEHKRAGAADQLRRNDSGNGEGRGKLGRVNESTGRASDTVPGQYLRDLREKRAGEVINAQSEFIEIKAKLDARRLLAELSQSHGVLIDKFEVSKGKDGSDRIKCGTRNLNVSDFLTKEMKFGWAEASTIMRESYARQRSKEPVHEPKQEPRRDLWAEYREYSRQAKHGQAVDQAAQRESEQERRDAIKREYQRKRIALTENRELSPAERKAERSIIQMERIVKDAALKEAVRLERELARSQRPASSSEGYRAWLAEQAQAGDEKALAELRRQRPTPLEKERQAVGYIKPSTVPRASGDEVNSIVMLKTRALTYKVHDNGDVTYKRDGEDLLRDVGKRVEMIQQDKDAIETGLRLAMQKFGSKLTLSGPKEFQEKAAMVAANAGMKIEFSDPSLNKIVVDRRAEIEGARAQEAEMRKLGQAFQAGERERAAAAAARPPVGPAAPAVPVPVQPVAAPTSKAVEQEPDEVAKPQRPGRSR